MRLFLRKFGKTVACEGPAAKDFQFCASRWQNVGFKFVLVSYYKIYKRKEIIIL